MSLKTMTKEEIELLSYNDITYMLLKESKKTMNTPSLFKSICDLLEYSEDEYAEKIGDYYTSLTIDKRFILLDDASWDLTEKHSVDLMVEDDEEIEEETEEDEDEEIEEETEDVDIDSDAINEEDIADDDGLDDLTIVDDEEIEES